VVLTISFLPSFPSLSCLAIFKGRVHRTEIPRGYVNRELLALRAKLSHVGGGGLNDEYQFDQFVWLAYLEPLAVGLCLGGGDRDVT
jgi:hypothetical protein